MVYKRKTKNRKSEKQGIIPENRKQWETMGNNAEKGKQANDISTRKREKGKNPIMIICAKK